MSQITVIMETESQTTQEDYDKFAVGANYQPIILVNNFQIPNPETKEEFFHRKVGLYVQNIIHQGALNVAALAAAEAVPKPIVTIGSKPVDIQPVPADPKAPKDPVVK